VLSASDESSEDKYLPEMCDLSLLIMTLLEMSRCPWSRDDKSISSDSDSEDELDGSFLDEPWDPEIQAAQSLLSLLQFLSQTVKNELYVLLFHLIKNELYICFI
jgi:hypothetical protein